MVSDLARMPEFSPELRKAFVLGRPGLGANVIGINRRKAVVWPTTSKVVRWEPGRAVAWKTRESGATWIYELEPTATGTRGHRAGECCRSSRVATSLLGPASAAPRGTTPSWPPASGQRWSASGQASRRPEMSRSRDRASRSVETWIVIESSASLLWANTGGIRMDLSWPPSRVGPVTENSNPTLPQMNGGQSVVRPRRPHLPAAAPRAHRLPRFRGDATRTPTRSAPSCCCSAPRTPRPTSSCTSTARAARSTPAWRSTTR